MVKYKTSYLGKKVTAVKTVPAVPVKPVPMKPKKTISLKEKYNNFFNKSSKWT